MSKLGFRNFSTKFVIQIATNRNGESQVYGSRVADSLVSETGHLYKGRTIIFFPGGIVISWRQEFFSPSIDKSFVGLN